MSILTKINEVRRTFMRKITRNIGRSHRDRNNRSTALVAIKKVLICRPNHRLGNLLLITPLVQEVAGALPGAKIDLFVKGRIAPTIFANYPNINRIIQLPKKPLGNLFNYLLGWFIIRKNHYDIVINVVNHSSSGRLSAKFANATYRFFGDINEEIQLEHKDHQHMAKFPVYSFRSELARLGFVTSKKPVPELDLKLSAAEVSEGKRILNGLVKNDRKTISLFTYATGDKCYSKDWWEDVYSRICATYPEYNIIEILPIESVSQIGFKAPSFYSKDIREIASLMANTAVFIGADSGMMHLASAAQVTTVGLFNVKDPNAYAPYNDNSVAINTNNNSTEDCMKILNRILNPALSSLPS